MGKKKTAATFVVRFVGPDLSPEEIPLRAVSDALSAVQDLASGRNRFETQKVPREKSIGLVKVRGGSAIYDCVARAPDEAIANLNRVAKILSSDDENESEGTRLVAALQPIEDLSDVARTIGCRLEVALAGRRINPMFAVEKDDYERISSRLLLSGDTTIIGNIKRVGGATGMKCLLRVPNRRRILYCDVKTRELVRRLGQHLYEDIVATGEAVWIHRSWYVYKFEIRDFTQPRLGNPKEALEELRNAGLSAWDKVKDPAGMFQELRP